MDVVFCPPPAPSLLPRLSPRFSLLLQEGESLQTLACYSELGGVPLEAQQVKNPTQCPGGFRFDPWPLSSG